MISDNPFKIESVKLIEEINYLKDKLSKLKELQKEEDKYRKVVKDFIKKEVLNKNGERKIISNLFSKFK